MTFRIKLADQVVEIHSLCSAVLKYCQDYIVTDDNPSIVVNIQDADILNELKEYRNEIKRNKHNGTGFVSESYLETIAVNRRIANEMPLFNTILMHGSVIGMNGYAYMFAAPSGVGKTTRTKLWLEQYRDSFVVNGDKPLVIINEKQAIACGTPWCGKEGWNTNTMIPLRAIFLLERAEDGEDSTINEIDINKAFTRLLKQTHRPNNALAMNKTLDLLKSLDSKVNIYEFRCARTPEAIQLAYETARPRINGD